ncbi:alpha/beta fold hydrolase [Streptomyces avidinii]|uniref:Pimeloyl-ACP methyl ester carboxylesterase n=1 Tax=Streptomyces avidinii TaxID=1895 RepID=A0ABS4LH83_STRAV|nr:alpha/beta fold hydrolase [Streptomyces avidinii]MBP2041492.1 pimeloyl-ACP methyl ester carboxylesterase [Streptomyces avidinii]GGZ34624.1 hydrolase [Streptomyces avidinii]
MPFVSTNGIRLSYQRSGRGEPVLLIMGSGAAGRVWTMHQTPALHRAGYETIVFDNRGIAPSSTPPGDYSLADMTADTIGLIEALDIGPCRIVGTSMGAMIAQELALARPELVRCAVLMATRARSDAARRMMREADRELRASGITLPPKYEAVRTVLEMLSPTTLNDEAAASGWLEIFELTSGSSAPGQDSVDTFGDRREALRELTVPCRAIAFSDDLICPPHLVAEVADAIPDCDYVEIPGCGHLGNLENPDEVNTAVIEFLGKY